jgi:hypothetical protein
MAPLAGLNSAGMATGVQPRRRMQSSGAAGRRTLVGGGRDVVLQLLQRGHQHLRLQRAALQGRLGGGRAHDAPLHLVRAAVAACKGEIA